MSHSETISLDSKSIRLAANQKWVCRDGSITTLHCPKNMAGYFKSRESQYVFLNQFEHGKSVIRNDVPHPKDLVSLVS